jgi:hypothetical protein
MAKHPLISGLRAQRLTEEIEKAEKANPLASRTKIRKIAEAEAEKMPFDLSPYSVGKQVEDKASRKP